MKIHDLRNSTSPTQPYANGDIVIYDNRPDMATVAQIRGNGNKPQFHLIDIVYHSVADIIISTGGEWCEPCHDAGKLRFATSWETSNRGDLFIDRYLCPTCAHERERQEHEDAVWYSQQEIADYHRTVDDMLAGTGRM